MTRDDDRDDTDLSPRSTDPAMQSMRSVWLSMRDEDPSSSGLDALMAAARTKAVEMQPKRAWWQSLFANLRRPPVLAFATVTVLLGGALVVASRRDSLDATSRVETPPVTSTTAPQAHRGPSSPRIDDKTVKPAEAEKPAEKKYTDADAHDPVGGAGLPRPSELKQKVVPPPPPPRVQVHDEGQAKSDHPKTPPEDVPSGPGGFVVVEGRSDPVAPPTKKVEEGPRAGQGSGQGDGSSLSIARDDAETIEIDATKTMSTPRPDTGGKRDPKAATTVDSKASVSLTEQLILQTESAAARGDCTAVRVMAERIRKADGRAYRTRLTANATISRCLK